MRKLRLRGTHFKDNINCHIKRQLYSQYICKGDAPGLSGISHVYWLERTARQHIAVKPRNHADVLIYMQRAFSSFNLLLLPMLLPVLTIGCIYWIEISLKRHQSESLFYYKMRALSEYLIHIYNLPAIQLIHDSGCQEVLSTERICVLPNRIEN